MLHYAADNIQNQHLVLQILIRNASESLGILQRFAYIDGHRTELLTLFEYYRKDHLCFHSRT